MSAIETWGEMVRVEHAQSDRMRGVRPTDTWNQFAAQFRANPHRTGDHTVDALRSRLVPGETLLDIGAGGGRLALPLALTCSAVTAVEPSPSMCAVLRETAAGVRASRTLHIVESSLAGRRRRTGGRNTVQPRGLRRRGHRSLRPQDGPPRPPPRHGRGFRSVAAVAGLRPVGAGPRRKAPRPAVAAPLPAGPRRDWASNPRSLSWTQQPPRTFNSIDEAREAVARWLYVTPETEAMTRLDQALQDTLREENGAWQIKGAQPSRPNIVSWETARR